MKRLSTIFSVCYTVQVFLFDIASMQEKAKYFFFLILQTLQAVNSIKDPW